MTGGKVQLADNTGEIDLANCKSDVGIAYIPFNNQLQIVSCEKNKLFAEVGDSGGTIYLFDKTTDTLTPAGMIIKTHRTFPLVCANTKEIVAFATPIKAIQSALKEMKEEYTFKKIQIK